jgi:hypothetical protein
MVYNQTYLPVPAMTRWRAGLRFPLPVEIDTSTGVATLNPSQIRTLAGAFDPAWTPVLDLHAPAATAPPATQLRRDVAAFLAHETTTLGRGIALGARALTNPLAELPFVRETFHQLGANAFDVALAFMDSLVNRDVGMLAAQRGGAAVLSEIRHALAAAPAGIGAARQASLTRANAMLGRVAGVAAQAAPVAARARPVKSVTVDTVKLDGSTHNPPGEVSAASAVFSQCNVRLVQGADRTATPAQTVAWLGPNKRLATSGTCGSATAEERRMFGQATAQFGLTGRIRVFFPAAFTGQGAGVDGYSIPAFCATGASAALRGMAVMSNAATTDVLAHELGHILTNQGRHHAGSNLMNASSGPQDVRLDNPQCNRIYRNS